MFALKTVIPIVQKTIEKLSPHVEVITIAGSVRREKREVKDIELVLVAKKEAAGQKDLFGQGVDNPPRITNGFLTTCKSLGKIVKGLPSGRMMQILLPVTSSQSIILDMFMPDPVDYWRQVVIRTGSVEYVRGTVAPAWNRAGWCGSDKGFRKIEDCEMRAVDKKPQWICVNQKAELPPIWESEKEFFEFIGLQYLNPRDRR